MTEQTPNSNGIGRFFGVLLRLFFVIVIGVLIGGGIFYAVVVGGPILYRTYVQPVENSIARIESTQTGQTEYNAFLNERLDGLQARIETIESQSDGYKQTISELQSQLDDINATIGAGEGEMQAGLDDLRQETETQIAELHTALDAVNSDVDDLDQMVGTLGSTVETAAENIVELEEQLANQDSPVAALRRELRLVQAMELLTRARMNIAGNNIGRATEDITATQELLTNLETLVPSYQTETVAAINERVSASLELIEASPVLAADELEVAWQLLRRGLPGEPKLQADPDAAPPETEATPTPSTRS